MTIFAVSVALILAFSSAVTSDPLTDFSHSENDQESVAIRLEKLFELFRNEQERNRELERLVLQSENSATGKWQAIVEEQRMEILRLRGDLEMLSSKTKRMENFLLKTETSRNANTMGGNLRIDSLTATMRTCQEIRSVDPSSPSGNYWIDPDGFQIGDPAISVYCDMTTGSTLISHDSEFQIDMTHCLDPGCYSRPINYEASMRQIQVLTNLLSESCQQYIEFNCYAVPFEFNGVPQAWWNDRVGDPQYYWAGDNSSEHTCQCGMDGNCVISSLKCNCDVAASISLSDSGFLTNKTALPVTQLNFGRTLLSNSYGRHALGKLECSGWVVVDRMPESCIDLWQIGYTMNGFFTVKGTDDLKIVYCDFSKLLDEGLETPMASIEIQSSPVNFYVQRNSQLNCSTNYHEAIPFQIEQLNVGGAMNLSNGIFTAPREGNYFFSFSGLFQDSSFDGAFAKLMLNDAVVANAYGAFNPQWFTLTMSSTLHLKKGDQVHVEAGSGILYDTKQEHFTQFNGFLL